MQISVALAVVLIFILIMTATIKRSNIKSAVVIFYDKDKNMEDIIREEYFSQRLSMYRPVRQIWLVCRKDDVPKATEICRKYSGVFVFCRESSEEIC